MTWWQLVSSSRPPFEVVVIMTLKSRIHWWRKNTGYTLKHNVQLLTQYSPPKKIWNKLTFQKYKVYHCNFCLFLFWVLFNFLKIKWYETKNENKLLGFSYSKNMANVEAFQFSLSFHSAKASYFEEFICKMEKIHKSTFDGKISWRLNLIFSQCVVASYTFLPKWNHFKRFHSLCLCKEECLIKSFM